MMQNTFLSESGGSRRHSSLPRQLLPSRWHAAVVMLAGLVAHASHAQAPHFRISGTVVNTRDSALVNRCHLAATLSGAGFNRGGNRQPVEVQSDEHGRFTLDLPSAGNWRLSATARNVHSQAYEEHEGFFTGIVLTREHPVETIVFHAVPDAVLAGVVIDEAGEPVRNAPVALIYADQTAASSGPTYNPRTQPATTDDRGHYEFAGLEPGSYLVNVRARPWYALMGSSGLSSQDPSLDLTYPVTWYPGVTEDTAATPIVVHAGDRLQADFHLLAIPSAHLILPSNNPARSASDGTLGGGAARGNVQVSLLLPNGGVQQVFGSYTNTPSGELDMGGLAPGTYQVTLPGSGPRDPGRTTVIRVNGGGTVTDVSAGSSDASLSVMVDGNTSVDPSQIALVDTASGRVISPGNRRGRPGNFNPEGFGGPSQPRRAPVSSSPPKAMESQAPSQSPSVPVVSPPRNAQATNPVPASVEDSGGLRDLPQRPSDRPAAVEVTVELPPARYLLTIPANSGAFLTGITATGNAQAEGRFLTIRDGAAHILVHLASGLATVDGVATFHGKPSAGALVLLIPATLGSPTSLATVHRDQSNTDGSFRLAGVIPGQYILVAIDHGWSVHWNDPATLRAYLLEGTPLDLASAATIHSPLQAVVP